MEKIFCFQAVTPLLVVPADTALRLKADLDFVDDADNHRVAGDEWLFEGPGGKFYVKINIFL